MFWSAMTSKEARSEQLLGLIETCKVSVVTLDVAVCLL